MANSCVGNEIALRKPQLQYPSTVFAVCWKIFPSNFSFRNLENTENKNGTHVLKIFDLFPFSNSETVLSPCLNGVAPPSPTFHDIA
jgi:hypothetical protein